jgi:N-acetylmuramoyl-L-alanine amidase
VSIRLFLHSGVLPSMLRALAFVMFLLAPVLAAQGSHAQTQGATQPATPAVQATASRLQGNAERTTLTIELSQRIQARAFLLADPPRVVIDSTEVSFRLPPEAGREGLGLISAFRFGLFAPGASRIVVDLNHPALIERADVENFGGRHRLVLELSRSTREALQRAARTTPIPAVQVPVAPRSAQSPPERPLIVLDPGHGGIDAGAVASDGTTEKSIVLMFARSLRDVLEASGRVRVALTRDDDRFVTLSDRVRFAREREAALFVSIHADSLRGVTQDVRGATLYTLSETASDREAAQLADRENRSDLAAGVDLAGETDEVADILVDLMRRETQSFSIQFARSAVRELGASIRLSRNPHRFGGFRVLRAQDVPSALLELGFLSSREDVRALTSEEWRKNASGALARAIIGFATRMAGDTTAPQPARANPQGPQR